MISDLPRDLTERVLSRLPVTSLRGVRCTCKKWKKICKNRSFTKRHIGEAKAAAKKKKRKEFQVVMMLNYRVYLYNVTNLINPSLERTGKLISLTGDMEISEIFHCKGLLLCVTKDKSRLVVWNPCSGQTRWIEPARNSCYHWADRYALGYERKHKYSLRSHKVLRFVDDFDLRLNRLVKEFEIYNLNSNSWKVVDQVNPDWDIEYIQRGLSLKGNTYWYAHEKIPIPETPPDGPPGVISDLPDFLIAFDFTTERFGPRLRLPFHGFYGDTVTFSSVREKQLAVLCQKFGAPQETVKIWITTKIQPNAVSWTKFLSVDMEPLTGFQFLPNGGSFFLDEKNKVAVVLDKDRPRSGLPLRNIAYVIGKKGFFKQVDLAESKHPHCWPLVCSFLPSSVKIKKPRGNQNKP